jgi:predicted Rossmann fold flavoprotein
MQKGNPNSDKTDKTPWDLIVVGGGAAGFFGAIQAGESCPGMRILILEKGVECLQKVRVSGGGRCNVTHACYEADELVHYYPRGHKELLGPFHHFGPADTVAWFEASGVTLKTEEDGRMFPVTDDSATIIKCFMDRAKRAGIEIRTHAGVTALIPPDSGQDLWKIQGHQQVFQTKQILFATGSSAGSWKILDKLGLKRIEPVPSLFTFNIPEKKLIGMAGISVPHAEINVTESKGLLEASGPLLITHWGLSGPAILKLSAWGARILNDRQYQFGIEVNWVGKSPEEVEAEIRDNRDKHPKRLVSNTSMSGLPQRLWHYLISRAKIAEGRRWTELRKEEGEALVVQLTAAPYTVAGRSTFKEEFVTAGGVDLQEMDMKTFAVKRYPGLYIAGEVLNIDAVTGGFNFQAAWTGGYLAGRAIAGQCQKDV